MGWKKTFTFAADSLRTTDLRSYLSKTIYKDQRLRVHKYDINIILSELLSNALNYGVLRLDSSMKKDPDEFEQYFAVRQRKLDSLTEGWIKVDLEHVHSHSEGRFVLCVEDSGSGFDYQNLDVFSDSAVYGGRGIYLVRSLCETLVFHGNGNRVESVYVWRIDD